MTLRPFIFSEREVTLRDSEFLLCFNNFVENRRSNLQNHKDQRGRGATERRESVAELVGR